MNYTTKLVKLAIEGGWKPKIFLNLREGLSIDGISNDGETALFSDGIEDGLWAEVELEKIFLDPKFWQALIKPLLKDDPMKMHKMFNITPTISNNLFKAVALKLNKNFIEHIHDNKDIESFCKQLIDKAN